MKITILRNNREILHTKYEEIDTNDGIYDDVYAVRNALVSLGHKVNEIVVDEEVSQLKKLKTDLVFNLCDDFLDPIKEAVVPLVLQQKNIKYTGSGASPLVITANKYLAKLKFLQYNIPTPNFQLFQNTQQILRSDLKFPLIVKPNNEHGSIGITEKSIVNNEKELYKRIKFIIKEGCPALVEEYIDGKEITIVLIGKKNPIVLPVSEIIFQGFDNTPKIMSYEAKWVKDNFAYKQTFRKTPADIKKQEEKEIIKQCKKAYEAIGCKGYGRVDLRLKDGIPYILEVNPNPDLSEDAAFSNIAREYGMTYNELIKKIIDLAIEE
ncbi:MAG: ATP-grasp domain-containing protein [Candidatus Woesearchaeota archaeon]